MIKYDPKKIKSMYDKKITDENDLNVILAKDDKKIFNHSGIVLPDEPFKSPKNEEDILKILHKMETNLVRYSLKYFGQISKDDIVLDAGCGAGGTSIMIHEAFGCRIEGFDLSTKNVEFAKKAADQFGYSDSILFAVGDILHLPRQNQFYDVITCYEASEHLPNLNPMFAEFRRVIKSFGRLIIIAWCAKNTSAFGKIIKSKIDNHYMTSIHTYEQYIDSANKYAWELIDRINLTSLTLPYWNLRNSSRHKTGSEIYFCEGYSTGNLEYYLLTFTLRE